MEDDKEWYLVDRLTCDDIRLCGVSNGVTSLDIDRITALKLECTGDFRNKDAVTFKYKNEKYISFSQLVFSDFGAAYLFFRTCKKQIINTNTRCSHFERILIRRVLAKSRDEALSLPPSDTHGRDSVVLADFPKATWFDCNTLKPVKYEKYITTDLSELAELIQKTKPHDLVKRLVDGFSPLGFCLVAADGYSAFEFRKPDSPLTIAVHGGEGGATLSWVRLDSFNIPDNDKRYLLRHRPAEVEYESFSDRDEFWQKIWSLNDVKH